MARDSTEQLIAQASNKELTPSQKYIKEKRGKKDKKPVSLKADIPKTEHLLWYNEKNFVDYYNRWKSEGYGRSQIDPLTDSRRVRDTRPGRDKMEMAKRGGKIAQTGAKGASSFAENIFHVPYLTSWATAPDGETEGLFDTSHFNLYTPKGEKMPWHWWQTTRHIAGYLGPTHYVADLLETVAETGSGVIQLGAGGLDLLVDSIIDGAAAIGLSDKEGLSKHLQSREKAVEWVNKMAHYQFVQKPLAMMIMDLTSGDADTVIETVEEIAKYYSSVEDIENRSVSEAMKMSSAKNFLKAAAHPFGPGGFILDKIFGLGDLGRKFKMWAAGVEVTEKDAAEIAQALYKQYEKIKLDDKETAVIRQFAAGALGHWDDPKMFEQKLRQEPTEVAFDILDAWLGIKGLGKGRAVTTINNQKQKLKNWYDKKKTPKKERLEMEIGTPDSANITDNLGSTLKEIGLGDFEMHRRELQGKIKEGFDKIKDDMDNFGDGLGAEVATPEGVRMPMPTPNEMRDRVVSTQRAGRPDGEVDGDEFPDWADETPETIDDRLTQTRDNFVRRENAGTREQVERVRNAISPNPTRARELLDDDALDYVAEIAQDWDDDALQSRMIAYSEVTHATGRPIRRDEIDEINAFFDETERLFPSGTIDDMDAFTENAERFRNMINRFEERAGRDPIYVDNMTVAGSTEPVRWRDRDQGEPQQPFSDNNMEVRREISREERANAHTMLEGYGGDLRTSEGRAAIRDSDPDFNDRLRQMVADSIAFRREGLSYEEADAYSQAIQAYYSTPMREHTISDAWYNIEVPDYVTADELIENVAQRLEEELYIEFQDNFPIPETSRQNLSEAERLELERRGAEEPHPFSVEGQRTQAERHFESADPAGELQSLRGQIDDEMAQRGSSQAGDFEVTPEEVTQIANHEMNLDDFTQTELNQLQDRLMEIDTAESERAAIVVQDAIVERESLGRMIEQDREEVPATQDRLDPSDPRNQGWNPEHTRQTSRARQRRETTNQFDSTENYPEPFHILERADEIREQLDDLPPNTSRHAVQALEQELAEAMAAFRRRLPGGGTRLYTGLDPELVAKAAGVAVSKVKAFFKRAKENFTVDKDDIKIALGILKHKLDKETVKKTQENYTEKMAQKAAIIDMIQKLDEAAKDAMREKKGKHERGKVGRMTKEGAARPFVAGVRSIPRTFSKTGSALETVRGFFKAIEDAKVELTRDRARMGLPKKGQYITKGFLHNLDAAMGKTSTEIIAKVLDEAGYTSDPKSVAEVWKRIRDDESKGQFGVPVVLEKLNEAREEVAIGIEIDAFIKHKLLDKRGEQVLPEGRIPVVLSDKLIKELNWYMKTLDRVYTGHARGRTSPSDPAFKKVHQRLKDFINRRKELNMTQIDAVWEGMIHDPKLKDQPIIKAVREGLLQAKDVDRKHQITKNSISEIEHQVINAFLGEVMDSPLQIRERSGGKPFDFKPEDIEDLYHRIQSDPDYQSHRDYFNSIYNSVEVNDFLEFWNDISARFLHQASDEAATTGLQDTRIRKLRKMMQENFREFAFEQQKGSSNMHKNREDFRTLSKGMDQVISHLEANHNQLVLNAVGDRIKNPDKMKKFFLNDASPKDIRNLITFLLEDGRKVNTARFTRESGMMAKKDPGKISVADLKKGLKSENPLEWTPQQQVIMLRGYLLEEIFKDLSMNIKQTPPGDNIPQVSGAELTNIHKFKRTLEKIGHNRGLAIFGEDVWNDLQKMTLTSHWAQRASRIRGDDLGGLSELADIPERVMLYLRRVKAGKEYRRSHKVGDPDPMFRELIGALAVRMKEWKPLVQLGGRRLEQATDKPEKLKGIPETGWLDQNINNMMDAR